MSDYYPDKWVVLKITPKKGKVWYRVFGSWYGGYAGADSWKLNSGITKAEFKEPSIMFHGTSGSVYYCHKNHYGMSSYSQSVLLGMQKQAEEVGAKVEVIWDKLEVDDWLEMEWT